LVVGLTVPFSIIVIVLVLFMLFLVFIRKICKNGSQKKPSFTKDYINYLIRRPVTPKMPVRSPSVYLPALPIPFCDIHPHSIETTTKTIRKNNFLAYSFHQQSQIESKIHDLIENEIIFEADNLKEYTSWLNNPVITEDGEFFIDMRNLNAVTVKKFNTKFLDMKQIIEKLKFASVFSVFNLNSVHSQIKLSEETRFKTAFESPKTKKVYYFNTMPYLLNFYSKTRNIFYQYIF
jgi:hypothetical protein